MGFGKGLFLSFNWSLNFRWVVGCSAMLLSGGCDSGMDAGLERVDPGARAREVLPSMRRGLEYRRQVVVGHGDGALVRALAVYELASDADETGATPAGFPDAGRRARLRANGFRLIPVPMEMIEEVVGSIGAAAVLDSTWLGQATDWMMLASGPRIGGTRIFSIGGEMRSYNEGQFRLLSRSYVVPFPDRTIIRVEFLPQWYFEERNYFSADPGAGRLSGELLVDFGWALNLDGTMAAVLVCEDPLVEWRNAAEEVAGLDEGESGDDGEDAEEGGGRMNFEGGERARVGPEPIPIRTLGEEVLQSVDGERRLVIVFLPHLDHSARGG